MSVFSMSTCSLLVGRRRFRFLTACFMLCREFARPRTPGVRWVALALAVVPFVCPAVASSAAYSDDARSLTDRPNFVLIVCDNLGYGDIEPFGSTEHRTPALQQMAREGMRLTHFYVTAGVCTPSRASIMTGCYAQRVGMQMNPRDGIVLRPISPYGLNPDEVTIAEILKQRGYATGLIGKWHLGDQPEFLPTSQGFDLFFGVPYSDDMTREVGVRLGRRYDGRDWPPLPLMRNRTVIDAPVDRHALTTRYTHEAVAFIEQHRKEPFFLYLPHATPGSTLAPLVGKRFQGRSKTGPWGDAVEELDWSTGAILHKLKELDLARRTLVIWTSDNGAPLARRPTDRPRGSNHPLSGRGYTTSEGGFRVPTIVWWPGHVPAGATCGEMATTMDLLPTLAHLAGAKLAGDRKIDGYDIRPLLFGAVGAKSPYHVFFYYYGSQLQAVRSGRWKLFLPLEKFAQHPYFRRGEKNQPLLFDVVNDVGSTRNMADQHPDIVRRLSSLAEQARDDLGDVGKPGAGQRSPGHVAAPKPCLMR